MQTSIEWLEKELKERYSLINSEPLFEQAKEMYKQEIIDAFWNGSSHWDSELEAEQYYNEIFKKD